MRWVSVRRLDMWTLGILALALTCRVALVVATRHAAPDLDAVDYDRIARSLATGDGFPQSIFAAGGGPTALRPPAYPLMLAAVYVLAPIGDHLAARLVQAVVGTAAVGLVGVLGWQLFGRRAALIAMAIAAVYPPLILADSALLSEALFTPLMLAALAAGLASRHARTPARWAALSGVLIGLCVLTRQTGGVLVVPVLAAILSAKHMPRRSRLVAATVTVVAASLVVLPWTIRNAVEFDAFIPVSTQAGVLLAGTYNDTARLDAGFPGAWRPPNAFPEYADLFADRSLSEAQLDAELRRRAVRYARTHPGYVISSTLHNVQRMLQLAGADYERASDRDRNIVGGLGAVSRWGFYLLALVALAGACMQQARQAPWYFWAAPALLFGAGMFFAGLVRYRTAVDPFLILLAALAVVRLRLP